MLEFSGRARALAELILWRWLATFCVHSGNGSHLAPVFDCLTVMNSARDKIFAKPPSGGLLTPPHIAIKPFNVDAGNGTSNSYITSSFADLFDFCTSTSITTSTSSSEGERH